MGKYTEHSMWRVNFSSLEKLKVVKGERVTGV